MLVRHPETMPDSLGLGVIRDNGDRLVFFITHRERDTREELKRWLDNCHKYLGPKGSKVWNEGIWHITEFTKT